MPSHLKTFNGSIIFVDGFALFSLLYFFHGAMVITRGVTRGSSSPPPSAISAGVEEDAPRVSVEDAPAEIPPTQPEPRKAASPRVGTKREADESATSRQSVGLKRSRKGKWTVRSRPMTLFQLRPSESTHVSVSQSPKHPEIADSAQWSIREVTRASEKRAILQCRHRFHLCSLT